jgi:hypothetical protein
MTADEDSGTTRAEDIATEAVVMQQILDFHPAQVTVADLVREIGGEAPEFGESDAIERAVRDLTSAGLLHRNYDFVMPTRAALRFSQLLER